MITSTGVSDSPGERMAADRDIRNLSESIRHRPDRAERVLDQSISKCPTSVSLSAAVVDGGGSVDRVGLELAAIEI